MSTSLIPRVTVALVHEAVSDYQRDNFKITDHHDAAAALGGLAMEDREHFVCLYLDIQNRVIASHTVSIGSVCMTMAPPREVFKAAILANASHVILAHNHPSGNTTPSVPDRKLTECLVKAGELLEITVLDHIIVGPNAEPFSFRRAGMM